MVAKIISLARFKASVLRFMCIPIYKPTEAFCKVREEIYLCLSCYRIYLIVYSSSLTQTHATHMFVEGRHKAFMRPVRDLKLSPPPFVFSTKHMPVIYQTPSLSTHLPIPTHL